MTVTLKDIAKRLNLSVSTVSRALHNPQGISPKTAELVHKIAEEMHYLPNSLASSLRTKRSQTLGVIVPEVSSYFFASALAGINTLAAQHNYQTIICQSGDDPAEEAKQVEILMSGKVDGLLISVAEGTREYEHILEAKEELPVVLFDRIVPDLGIDWVEADDYGGAYQAVLHLLSCGYRKIAHLAGPAHLANSRQRLAGYRAALQHFKVAADESLIHNCGFEVAAAKQCVNQLLAQHPDVEAIFAVNDEVGVAAIQTLKRVGYNVPERVAVIGFGNYPISQIIEPELSTVQHNAFKIGQEAAAMLFSRLTSSNHSIVIFQKKVIATQVIVRQSTHTRRIKA